MAVQGGGCPTDATRERGCKAVGRAPECVRRVLARGHPSTEPTRAGRAPRDRPDFCRRVTRGRPVIRACPHAPTLRSPPALPGAPSAAGSTAADGPGMGGELRRRGTLGRGARPDPGVAGESRRRVCLVAAPFPFHIPSGSPCARSAGSRGVPTKNAPCATDFAGILHDLRAKHPDLPRTSARPRGLCAPSRRPDDRLWGASPCPPVGLESRRPPGRRRRARGTPFERYGAPSDGFRPALLRERANVPRRPNAGADARPAGRPGVPAGATRVHPGSSGRLGICPTRRSAVPRAMPGQAARGRPASARSSTLGGGAAGAPVTLEG